MAGREQLSETQRKKEQLVDKLAVARETMKASKAMLKEGVNVKSKISRGVKNNRGKIIASSAVATLLCSLIFKRKQDKPSKLKKGFTGWVKGIALGFVVKKAKGVVINSVRDSLVKRIEYNNTENYRDSEHL